MLVVELYLIVLEIESGRSVVVDVHGVRDPKPTPIFVTLPILLHSISA